MPVYTLYLSTLSTTPVTNQSVRLDASLNNCKWNINWDEFFRMQNKEYKRCRIRIKLQSSSWSAVAADWERYLGYLTCNLPSNSNGFGTYGTILSPVYAQDLPTTGTTSHCILLDTSSDVGVDIMVPRGFSDFILSFNRTDLGNGSFMTPIYDYQVFLYFELYDPII